MAKRILILDDDRDILSIVKEVLQYEGYEVITAEATTDILALVHQVRPQLLLIDFLLKGTNGGELCRIIKEDPASKNLPVIIYSAFSNKNLKTGGYGCDNFISKPFDLDELINKIRDLTQKEYPEQAIVIE